ncbi:MAG: DUF3800 domain-containing protein [Bacteroidota bacterium]
MEKYDLFNQPDAQTKAADKPTHEGEQAIKEAKLEAKRARILERVRGGRDFSSLEERVAYVLSQFDATPNSDIALQLQYWEVFEPDLLASNGMPSQEGYYRATRLTQIVRARRVIQNDLGLFIATVEDVAIKRRQRAEDFRVAHIPQDVSVPAVFVYADESGKNEANLVVGSVWMIAPGEFQRFQAECEAWREANDVRYELHSASLGKPLLTAYKDFISRFVIGRGSLGFKAVSVPSDGIRDSAAAFTHLFHVLLREGIRHEHESGRAPLPRHIYFTKDAESAGADQLLILKIQGEINRDATTLFNNKLICTVDEPADSSKETLLQIADLFTWAVNRRLNHPDSTNWKGEFANWFLNEIGFELDQETVLGDRAVRLGLRSPLLSPNTVPVISALEDPDLNASESDSGETEQT